MGLAYIKTALSIRRAFTFSVTFFCKHNIVPVHSKSEDNVGQQIAYLFQREANESKNKFHI